MLRNALNSLKNTKTKTPQMKSIFRQKTRENKILWAGLKQYLKQSRSNLVNFLLVNHKFVVILGITFCMETLRSTNKVLTWTLCRISFLGMNCRQTWFFFLMVIIICFQWILLQDSIIFIAEVPNSFSRMINDSFNVKIIEEPVF